MTLPRKAWVKPVIVLSFDEETLQQKMSNKELLAHGGSFPFDWSNDFVEDIYPDWIGDGWIEDWIEDWVEDWVEDVYPDWSGDGWPGDMR